MSFTQVVYCFYPVFGFLRLGVIDIYDGVFML